MQAQINIMQISNKGNGFFPHRHQMPVFFVQFNLGFWSLYQFINHTFAVWWLNYIFTMYRYSLLVKLKSNSHFINCNFPLFLLFVPCFALFVSATFVDLITRWTRTTRCSDKRCNLNTDKITGGCSQETHRETQWHLEKEEDRRGYWCYCWGYWQKNQQSSWCQGYISSWWLHTWW